ncbi:MAG TPA: triose-phosphate isomerase [Jiangellaceae bacterium]
MSTTARQPLMAGNWKANLNHFEAIAHVQKLAFSLTDEDFDAVDVAVLPPFTNLRSVQTLVNGEKLRIGYGAQDVSEHDSGPHTGEITGAMLATLGCTYVIVGHSERRQYHAESDALVNAKARAALRHGMAPILCVGEGLDVRREGRHISHTLAQLDGGLTGVPAGQAASVVVAYEPVWAIGTGEVAKPEDAQEVCMAIRDRLGELYSTELAQGARILYGGSVKVANIGPIMEQPDVDGALVGGASINADEFAAVCRFGSGS